MAWDGSKYEHLSGDPRQPYWMLGKGLFFHAQDIYDLGGFHPWITIEDPEVGLRLWKNGKNLGIMEGSLIEEAPTTFANAILQRKRWDRGLLPDVEIPRRSHGPHGLLVHRKDQGLADLPSVPDDVVQLSRPTLSVWAAVTWYNGTTILPLWCLYWSAANLGLRRLFMIELYWRTWFRTKLIMDTTWQRVRYMLRVNPIFLGCGGCSGPFRCGSATACIATTWAWCGSAR